MSTNGSLAPIQKVFQMAKKTFARTKTPGPDGKRHHRLDPQDLMTHLRQLSDLMNVLTARDLGLDQSKVTIKFIIVVCKFEAISALWYLFPSFGRSYDSITATTVEPEMPPTASATPTLPP